MAVALITGASRGFGRALARRLAASGRALVIDGRDASALDAVAAELRDRTAVIALAGDVADAAHRRALVDAARGLGGLDLLVNNASTLGPTPLPPLSDYSPDALAHVFAVNTLAPLALIQHALPLLRERRGTIVNVTSDAAVEAYEGWGGYGASKAALEQLGRVLAAEEPTVRVVTFDPGDMRTQMHQDAFPGEDISDRPEPETVVPALVELLDSARPSGRYRAADLAAVPS
ncbi:MAG TPA: SDR family NAD(P)-dependent oxidoreductase [Acidimicrobiia bacterium]|nr:SDR family NAD(P)-dependent oxidoreductase [Acidimicrobiia bacterium]